MKKLIAAIRIILSLLFVYMIYLESGFYTSLAILFFGVSIELQNIINTCTNKSLKMLAKG